MIWQNGREGKYGNLHYEIAALGLGDLLRSEKKYQAAAAAYELVSEVAGADPELLQKANLGAGEMYDQLQKRDLAVKNTRQCWLRIRAISKRIKRGNE